MRISGSLAEQYVHNNARDKTFHRLMQYFPNTLRKAKSRREPRTRVRVHTRSFPRKAYTTSVRDRKQHEYGLKQAVLGTYTTRACMHGRVVSGSRASVNARCSHISHRLQERQCEAQRCPGCCAAGPDEMVACNAQGSHDSPSGMHRISFQSARAGTECNVWSSVANIFSTRHTQRLEMFVVNA